MIVTDPAGAQPLSIRTFGALAIALGSGSEPLRFATRTVEALLVYLACQDRPLGRDELAELLWPERTHEQSRMNLRVAIYRLRGQIEPYLLITRQHLALNPNASVNLDVRQFQHYLAAGQLDPAVALYRGDFLGGFYLDGSPAFEQWALLERERLRTLAIAAYQQLVERAATEGQPDAATAYAQRLLQLDALHEPTHRQLMRLLARTGQRSAAIAQYETCRNLLAAELGVVPDEATTALYQQICQGVGIVTQEYAGHSAEPTSIGDLRLVIDDFSSTPHLALVPHNLPLQPTPLIGRNAELAQIESLLANPDCRLLTLLGAGGIGKTRLAIEVARRMLGAEAVAEYSPIPQVQELRFPDGVCFVALASVENPELVLATIAQSLELQIRGSDLQTELADYLQGRTLLLVLDNFEHLPDAADSVAQLLQNAARVKLLVTSRERLHLREEWLMPVDGLPQAEGLLSEAGQLFFRNAQRVQPGFSSYGQEEAIAAICAQVEGMPLALELAASWVRVMSCAEIAHQLAQNSYIFTTTLRNVPERHRSLRTLFDQSWRLLSSTEQTVLQRVSVFRGGWTLEEGAQVADATLPILVGLVDKSLVRTNGQGRFDLHELVRQYAAEQLGASGELDLIRQRHHAAYLQLFCTGDSHLRGPESASWFARLEAEQDNLRAALQWALDEAHYADAAGLMAAATYFWMFGGSACEETWWLARLLPHRAALFDDLRLETLAAFIWAAQGFEEFMPFGQSSAEITQYSAEIMQLIEGCSDKALKSFALNMLAGSVSTISSLDSKVEGIERALAWARAGNDPARQRNGFSCMVDPDWVLAYILENYARFLIDRGEVARAVPLVNEGLELMRTLGNQGEFGDCLGILGRIALLRGDLDQAHTYFHQAVSIATTFSLPMPLSEYLPYLALVTLYRGDAAEARRLLRESLRLCLKLKDRAYISRVYTCLAETALWEGELEEATQWLAQSVTYDADPHRIENYLVRRLFIAACLATAQQRFPRAATIFGLADQAHSRIHNVIGGPPRAKADAAIAAVRAALDPAVFAEAFAAGQQLSFAEAFATLLAPVHIAPTPGNLLG